MRVGLDAFLDDCPSSRVRVALLSHQAALSATGETAAQRLRRYYGENLVALFAPEHGYFVATAAGEKIDTISHPLWQIPVYSLYGDVRKPTPDMLRGIELVIVDLQDIGVRCYTYLATLKLMLEVCAEQGIPVIVCDRPVPLPGAEDGAVAQEDFFSFVAPCALPLVYGRTQSEVATWLELPHQASPMRGYTLAFERPHDAPQFIPPSPAIRSWTTAQTYPALVFCEALAHINCHRHEALAFQAFSAPWIEGEPLAEYLNTYNLPGIRFVDYTQQINVGGVLLVLHDPTIFKPATTSLAILRALGTCYGKDIVWHAPEVNMTWFDKLYGTDTVRKKLLSECSH